MDLLLKRYASPFAYLDILIKNKRLTSFIEELAYTVNEEKLWELYLHRYIDCSFEQWRESIGLQKINGSGEVSKEYVETTVKHSEIILSNFNPTVGEEAANGIV